MLCLESLLNNTCYSASCLIWPIKHHIEFWHLSLNILGRSTIASKDCGSSIRSVIHDTIGLVHTLAAAVAMLSGAIVLLRPKGGRIHRLIGYLYASSMILMLGTSFAMYRLTGSFNVLHGAAIFSTLTLSIGLKYAITRRPVGQWFIGHYHWMSWSYVGLIAAFFAELSTRVAMPYLAAQFPGIEMGVFWLTVGLVSAFIVWIGGRWIRRFAPPLTRSSTAPDSGLDHRGA